MKSDSEGRAVERLVALALSGRVSLLILLLCASARAETLQAPWGGKPIPLGEARVPCGSPGGGWVFDDKARALVPASERRSRRFDRRPEDRSFRCELRDKHRVSQARDDRTLAEHRCLECRLCSRSSIRRSAWPAVDWRIRCLAQRRRFWN
jgi:hypothetical protein